ncbi:hypothetical protein ABZ942_22370 [Nocardia sp. NPDC046473]|uniref:hypothetical protein n=1 Tax=Nocardia sp. NPDC046473 TaxID=3155733 RepID=UPI0033C51E7D
MKTTIVAPATGISFAELAAMRPALRQHLAPRSAADRGHFSSFIADDGHFNSFISPAR